MPSFKVDRLSYIATPDFETVNGKIYPAETQRKRSILKGRNSSFNSKRMNSETKLARKCQSDYVRMVIELAYLPENKARKLTLTSEALMEYVLDRKEYIRKQSEKH